MKHFAARHFRAEHFAARFLAGVAGAVVTPPAPSVFREVVGGGGSMSLSEWRRRFGPQAALPAATPVPSRKRTKRQEDEELMLILH